MDQKDEKKKLGALEMILLVLALLTLVLIVIKIGFTLWFWIFIILWAALLLFWFFTKIFVKFIWLFWLLFIIWIILPITLVYTGVISSSSSSSGSSGGLVSCTSTASDQPTTISGYKATVFAQPVNYSGTADDGTRTFSIKSLDAKTGEDVFFHIEKADGGFITGTKGLIEVCNSNNMTQKYSSTADSITDGASSTALSATYYMHGNDKVTTPGTYRVDGYANVDGTWKLVGRVSNITVTE
jgi:energy-coupling factor transporter transmembrane protein EcfT